jgi:hypothetical protein
LWPPNLSEHRTRLETYIHEKGLKVTDDPLYAFHNAPFVSPPFRRNEIPCEIAVSLGKGTVFP